MKVLAEMRDIFVVGIQNRGAGFEQSFDEFALGARDLRNRVEEFEVNRGDAGYDAGFGLREAGEGGDLAQVRHAHLDYGDFMLGLEPQQHERQAEVVVQIADRLEHAIPGRKKMSDRVLRSGFARRSRDADDRLAPELADGGA